MAAAQYHCDNLIAITDYNKLQAKGFLYEMMGIEPLADKWRAFGWEVREIDGHDFAQIDSAFGSVPYQPGRPTCVIAHTIKGKGVSFMENTVLWHYRSPAGEELERAIREIEAGA